MADTNAALDPSELPAPVDILPHSDARTRESPRFWSRDLVWIPRALSI